MALTECNSCGATYDTVQADGTEYFHACAPLSAPELAAKIAAGKVVLPGGETVDQAVQRRVYERANKRDENPVSAKPADAGSMKSPGDGVKPGTPKTPPVVIVPK